MEFDHNVELQKKYFARKTTFAAKQLVVSMENPLGNAIDIANWCRGSIHFTYRATEKSREPHIEVMTPGGTMYPGSWLVMVDSSDAGLGLHEFRMYTNVAFRAAYSEVNDASSDVQP